MFLISDRNWLALLGVLIGFTVGTSTAQQPSAPDTAVFVDTSASEPPQKIEFTVEVEPTDTIPGDFFEIVDHLGVHSYTVRLLGSLDTISDELVLEAISRADMQTDELHANAYAVVEAIRLLCQQDSLWKAFFFDLDLQLKEPNIIRFNFRDDQKWKSYALNELLYSNAFQELLLIMGNLGIADSKDGRQWLPGWPAELRWKYREYQIEYIPEDQKIKVRDVIGQPRQQTPSPGSATRLMPSSPVLTPEPVDSVEPPDKVPRL